MSGLQLLMYLALIVFVAGTAYKVVKIMRMPVHLRWDLYPIPHEKGRNSYGGSYYEEVDWWTKPAQVTMAGEVKAMGKEIFFIQSMFEHNRPLWAFSFPFHIGLYLSVGFTLLVYLGAILLKANVAVAADAGTIGRIVYYLTVICGLAGAVLGGFGAIGLFFSRLSKKELRLSSNRTDYFNLLLLLAVFVTTIWVWTADPTFGSLRAFIGGLITFSPTGSLPAITVVNMALAAVFLLWLPATHMTHFAGKYFTYHKVRWEDHPNIRGSKLEAAITEALGYKIDWSAPHIKKGGTWAEAATSNDHKESSKDA
jgi:nitrate reductase gamma subunit